MPDNRVDTTRPEYSWIPFFEELARRLHEDGWRNRQPEIVAELQRMKREGMILSDFIDHLDDWIDPFSIFAMIRRVRGQNANDIMASYKRFFNIDAELPNQDPITPSIYPSNSLFFTGARGISEQTSVHWDTFRLAMDTDVLDEHTDASGLAGALDASLDIREVAHSKLTGVLYGIDPNRYLHNLTIEFVLGKGVLDYRRGRFGWSYIECLRKIANEDARRFPEINVADWESRGGESQRQSDERDSRNWIHPSLRCWMVWSGAGGFDGDTVVTNGYVGIGWGGMDIGSCSNRAELNVAWDEAYPGNSKNKRAAEVGSIFRFVFELVLGGVVLTTNHSGDFYLGAIRGEPTYDNHDGLPFETRRLVSWDPRGPYSRDNLPEWFWHGVNPTVLELKDRKRAALLEFLEDRNIGFAQKTYSVETMLDEGVLLEREQIEGTLSLLRRKQNLILQGPPGTGKTFIARRLGYALLGAKDDSRIASVQFHQSYSYEDFVGGLRPSVNDAQQLVFNSEDGAFLRLCEKARKDSDNDYVMLIDEINRGNLSRVFGELMMLIEPDKRKEQHSVELQHRVQMPDAASTFFVPPNVYIIGTMNLADRSLTGMNVAMRRRFGFVSLEPQFGESRFEDWLADNGLPRDDEVLSMLRTRIIERMTELNRSIQDDRSLGAQYAVGHSFFCPGEDDPVGGDWDAWYKAVIEHEIKPLLQEYWFDQPEKADSAVATLLGD